MEDRDEAVTVIASSEFIDVEISSEFGGQMAEIIDSVGGFKGWPDYTSNGGFGGTMDSKVRVLRETDEDGEIVSVGVVFVPAQGCPQE